MMTGSHFRTVQQFDLDYAPITISQYESTRTGMRVVVAGQEGPKVYGYFALATEIHDDTGAPHTLEHLCFMGSRSYKYKGLLDKLATRGYSSTNAWTDIDSTAYTLETAGWEGFAQLLPVYLEHVLLPTLTDAGCYTEVHHVDPTGRDAGVVYSEMQAVQNQQSSLIDLEARRLMYPEGNGFRYETGGMMENLRVLSADRIRRFHKDMYQPKNLCLVLIGQIDQRNMLQILDRFEDSILDEVPKLSDPFKRPWVDSTRTRALAKNIIQKVEFPEEDESTGEIQISFLGPDCNDVVANTAIRVLLTYLCESSVSVLENTLVEKEHLCSAVYYSVIQRPDLGIDFSISAVKTSQLADVEKRFFEVLKETACKNLDMKYLHDCMDRMKRQAIYTCESSANNLSVELVQDHLYGNRDGSDLKTIQNFDEHRILLGWTDQVWRDFMTKWLSDAKHVSILGVPSAALSSKLKEEEQARVKAQQDRLGESGLKNLAKKLEEAVAENDRPIPDSLLSQFSIPDPRSIHFIKTITARGGLARRLGRLDNEIQQIIDADDTDLPLFTHFEHISSKFLRLKLVIDTTTVPTNLKPLLTLYTMNFFSTPISRDGKKIKFEDVVVELERDTVGFGIRSGPGHSELLQIHFEVEPEKYTTAIQWIRTMLFDYVLDEERLNASLIKILADIPDEKRSGQSMSASIENMTEYTRDSVNVAGDTLVKSLYLKRIRAKLLKEPQSVLAQLEDVISNLHKPSNFRAYVAGDLKSLKHPVSSWNALLKGHDGQGGPRPIARQRDLLSDIGKSSGGTSFITPLPAIDSSWGRFVIKGVDSYDHPDLAAIMVAEAYLDAVEGPLWVAVRGTGLAYGAGWSRSMATGRLIFRIWRSPDCYKAYEASKKQIIGLSNGEIALDKLALEGAISSIIQGFADEQPTASTAAAMSFVNQVVRVIDKDWNDQMLKKVRDVGPDQVKDVLSRYFSKVFDPKSANMYITCAKIMEEGLVEKFAAVGFSPKVKALSDFEDDYGLGHVEGEEELGEEEDSEGSDASGSEDGSEEA